MSMFLAFYINIIVYDTNVFDKKEIRTRVLDDTWVPRFRKNFIMLMTCFIDVWIQTYYVTKMKYQYLPTFCYHIFIAKKQMEFIFMNIDFFFHSYLPKLFLLKTSPKLPCSNFTYVHEAIEISQLFSYSRHILP